MALIASWLPPNAWPGKFAGMLPQPRRAGNATGAAKAHDCTRILVAHSNGRRFVRCFRAAFHVAKR